MDEFGFVDLSFEQPRMSERAPASINPPKVLVVQYGARRQYAVPSALAEAKMLEALYTDLCATAGIGRVLSSLASVVGSDLTKLARRVPPPAVSARTKTFPLWRLVIDRAARIRSPYERVRALSDAHHFAGRQMVQAGFGDASHVLVMLMEAQGVLTAAKSKGLKTITDVNVALSSERIVRDEVRRNPGWEQDDYFWGETLAGSDPPFRPSQETLEKSDLFLCPSEFVRSDLIENYGVSADSTRLLPYAVNPRWFDVVPQPRPGRILFAGAAGLRKGIHILAEAALILQGRGRFYEYRIAGDASNVIKSRQETKLLRFLGRLDYNELRTEFAAADVLAFPSLAEGSAGVTYEALGCAVPVVTTRAAGSIVRDGIDGYIIEERNPTALADALEHIIEDRILRSSMAVAARENAQKHTWANYSERLGTAII